MSTISTESSASIVLHEKNVYSDFMTASDQGLPVSTNVATKVPATHFGKRTTIQPDIAQYYRGPGQVPQGLILTCVTHGSWFRGTHFSDSQVYIYVCRNAASRIPASSASVRFFAAMLDRGYGKVSYESPERVDRRLAEDIAFLKEENAKLEGFVQVKFTSVLEFWIAKRLAKRAGGAWLKGEHGGQRWTPNHKTYEDTSGRIRVSASTDFDHRYMRM
ncbi:hypothetical protein L198_00070 [Cryptococcus wingfieldii CBS 7118]|uniref:Uncharacterized protein n=1 Tax=Cryptococcus wingfieldii CBS 7118 TaxID=1295528 RepID=A0A1E3K5Q1_9TREE|nr:hypothetical protein L198_00070 [Cryptococcus wingfieldii CBS 7118]ODO08345.1 hypothetical protein L198_00070 [Cryptococcus wingfieldii CBS 7118]